MFVLGLTGNIASGKSTVSAILKSLGAAIIDADKVAREVVAPGMPGLQLIIDAFGREILLPDGSLDRAKLGRLVFSDAAELDKLNAITHPFIFERINLILKQLAESGEFKVAVIDAPLLIEVGLHKTVDELWVVALDPETQLRRVMERDNISRRAAAARIAAQLPQQEKVRLADVVIDNSGAQELLRAKVDSLWYRISGDNKAE